MQVNFLLLFWHHHHRPPLQQATHAAIHYHIALYDDYTELSPLDLRGWVLHTSIFRWHIKHTTLHIGRWDKEGSGSAVQNKSDLPQHLHSNSYSDLLLKDAIIVGLNMHRKHEYAETVTSATLKKQWNFFRLNTLVPHLPMQDSSGLLDTTCQWKHVQWFHNFDH